MIAYIYDGTFEGFLTCIYEAYYSKLTPEDIVKRDSFCPSLIFSPVEILTDEVKWRKVYSAIKNKISNEALKNIFHCFLSEIPGCEFLLYKYIKFGFKAGRDVDLHLYDNRVMTVHKYCSKVTGEAHKMLGFVRFKLLKENVYYSQIEPDHNILPLLAPHFSKRLSEESWIIQDLKRDCAAIYNKQEWVITELSKAQGEAIKERDDLTIYEKLWKEYYKSISIAERKNSRQQKAYMPVRYWKNMLETQD